MSDAKKIVRDLLDRLPDDCTLADVLEELRVLEGVYAGRADVEAGRVVPHEQVVAEMRKRWGRDHAE